MNVYYTMKAHRCVVGKCKKVSLTLNTFKIGKSRKSIAMELHRMSGYLEEVLEEPVPERDYYASWFTPLAERSPLGSINIIC